MNHLFSSSSESLASARASHVKILLFGLECEEVEEETNAQWGLIMKRSDVAEPSFGRVVTILLIVFFIYFVYPSVEKPCDKTDKMRCVVPLARVLNQEV